MITKIGIVAGEIWHYLEGHGDTSLEALIKGVDKPRDVVLMSLGWLAREGHIILEGAPNYSVSLRKKEELEGV
ncbi:MAG: winged helix-turn-helix domain-containing protein [Candidatus Omnitrophica bacterium]|nr:winged helix-turn-helix domain-containing protein [Candidatus Omnitrophota bacterium]